MFSLRGLERNRLSQALKLFWVAPLLWVGSPGGASGAVHLIDGVLENITGNNRGSDFRVINGGTLNSINAETGYIQVESRSAINLDSTQVVGADSAGNTLTLTGSAATLNKSALGGGLAGLFLVFDENLGQASSATVAGSIITGTDTGINMAKQSQVNLADTTVTATGPNGVGYRAFGAALTALNSQITGTLNGGLIQVAADSDVHSLTLDNSSVTGQTGSALVVSGAGAGPDKDAVINLSNGSTLNGGNGIILEVDSGDAQMNVYSSQLSGNVVVQNQGQVDLNLDQARMSGDVIAQDGSTANLALSNRSVLVGRLENVNNLALGSAAQWELTGDSTVANLVIDGASVKMGAADAFHTLSLGSLSGNGTFLMDADFAQVKVDYLNITGTATGSHSLLVGATGAEPVDPASLHVVHVNQGDAQFALLNGPVDVGTFRYELQQQGGNDWYLIETSEVTPSTGAVLALFNTAPTVWYGELSTLRSRMGELRFNGAQSGGWIRAYGNKYNAKAASNVGYKQTQHGVSFGADAPLPVGDGQWLVGVLGGFSESDLDLDRGTSGSVNSYYLGAYSTWMDPASGYYLDGVVKLNRLRNKAEVNMSDGSQAKGNYHNNGIGASVEFGRHIKLDDGYFIEPYGQLSGMLMQGQDYHLDNGMQAKGDQTRSLLGKLGATAGRNFDLGEGRVAQPYVRAAYAHEFASNNGVKVNEHRFNNDLSGSRGELGVGLAVSMSERLQVHADVDYSNGDKLEQPWGGNLGLRYSW